MPRSFSQNGLTLMCLQTEMCLTMLLCLKILYIFETFNTFKHLSHYLVITSLLSASCQYSKVPNSIITAMGNQFPDC